MDLVILAQTSFDSFTTNSGYSLTVRLVRKADENYQQKNILFLMYG